MLILVVGMHRSGTSLFTHILSKCDVSIGENLIGSGLGNEDGHFENLELVNFHEELLLNRNNELENN